MVSPVTAQHFWLLGTGDGAFDETDKSQLNTVNPVNRDTATLPPYGWVAFRFLVRYQLCILELCLHMYCTHACLSNAAALTWHVSIVCDVSVFE
jgi:Multicopper oxidase